MAFKKKTWTDRMVEYAGRRKLTNVSTKQAVIYDVERSEGTVSKEGDAFSSQNMNDLEQRVADGFSEVKQTTDGLIQNLAGLSITVTATDNSLQAILPTLYNTARDKGYLDRHNRTFHAMILNSSGAYMGDWNGYFSGDNTAIYGNAYSINLDSTYQFRTSAGGADAVIKKLGNPEVHRASGSGLIIDTGNPTGNIGGVTSLHYKGNYYCGNNNWIEMEYTMSITCENGIVRISGAPGGQGTFTVSAFSLTGD